ncbi:MFS transporter [Silvimonas iriomotensis]|uniref:MFS transporter n=1 Tax=Silvimonas iriomotensis TaxID=449662 RepID=A0ABQ2PE78_9NEIS|nr:MFS transporter [Silvimonas iriomotensis]GGP23544.1 hypothetical protein GCM10010970_35440 [Silvimonas iriomotensis]
MNASTTYASAIAPAPAWRSLFWAAPLTLLWIGVMYWQPVIPSSGFQTTAHQVVAQILIALGLWLALERTALTPAQRRNTWLAILIPHMLWFAVIWSAAIHGVFRLRMPPPLLPLLPLAIFLPLIVGLPLLLASKRVGQVLDAMPLSWLVALQFYRIFGGWALAAWLHGQLDSLDALPAGTGDVLTGLFAVPAAIALASGSARGRKAGILWNLFGLADFALAVALGMVTAPGRFQLIAPDAPSLNAGLYPYVLTPAFVVPGSILLHALSLRQLLRRSSG